MGLPALKHTARTQVSRRPHLKVVAPRERTSSKRPSSAAAHDQARAMFRMFAVLVTIVAILGMGRVWLSAQAERSALSSAELKAQIKSARYEGDILEVRRSALASPSRVRTIATSTMGMAPAKKVTYVSMADVARRAPVSAQKPSADPVAVASVASGAGGVKAALSTLIDLTAEEAQLLLVGDVGVSAAR